MSLIEVKSGYRRCLNYLIIFLFLFNVSCSNEERLLGQRENVLENQVQTVSDGNKSRLILNKPKNWASWNNRGRTATHNIGNLTFSEQEKYLMIKKKIGPKGIYNEPVVSKDTIYILTPSGYLVAYNTEGNFLWEIDVVPSNLKKRKTNIFGGIAIHKDDIILSSSLGEILSIDKKNKKINWRFDFKRPFRAPPLVYGNKIYAITGDDIALSLTLSGKLRWTRKGPQKATKLMSAATPAASGNKVLFPFSGGSLLALNAYNGLELWNNNFQKSRLGSALATIGDFGGDPVIVNSRVYAVSAFGEIFATSLNGNVAWRNNISGSSRLIVSGNSIFFVSGDNSLVRIDKKSGRLIYKTQELITRKKIRFLEPLLVENKLLVFSSNGYMMWFDPKNGTLLKESKIRENVSSPPILVDKKIIFVSTEGVLNIFY